MSSSWLLILMISYEPPNVITTHCPDPTSAVSLSGPSSILAGDVATFTCVSHNVSGHSTFRSEQGYSRLAAINRMKYIKIGPQGDFKLQHHFLWNIWTLWPLKDKDQFSPGNLLCWQFFQVVYWQHRASRPHRYSGDWRQTQEHPQVAKLLMVLKISKIYLFLRIANKYFCLMWPDWILWNRDHFPNFSFLLV